MGEYIGRKEELEYLNKVFGMTPASCALSGRRNLGKTSLIREFCKDKDSIYLTGFPGLPEDNLRHFSKALSVFSGKAIKVADIDELFPLVKKVCGKKKVVVVLDRFSDILENFPEFNSYLRTFMSREINNTHIMLLVSNSDNSVFGRFYYNLEVRPMTYLDCKGFHPDYSPLDHLKAYAVCGGTPAYQTHFQGDPDKMIRDQCFDRLSTFSLEAESLVSSETISRTSCVKVLSAIASGYNNIKGVMAVTGLSGGDCQKAIEDLENKGMLLIERSTGPSKRSLYFIHSNILRFYYEVVNKYVPTMQFITPAVAYEQAKDDIDAYLEAEFKKICRDYMTLNYQYSSIGVARRRDGTNDDMIDFMVSFTENNQSKTAAAMCRLYGDKMTIDDLANLRERSQKLPGLNKMYFLFSGCGFTDTVRKEAFEDSSIRLISLDEVYF